MSHMPLGIDKMELPYIPAFMFVESIVDQIESQDVHALKRVSKEWKAAVESVESRIRKRVIAEELDLPHFKYDRLDPDFNLPKLCKALREVPEIVCRKPRGKYKDRLRPLVDGSMFRMTRTVTTDEFMATSSVLCDVYKRVHAQYGDMSAHPWTRTHVSRWFLHMTLDYMYQRLFVKGGLSSCVYHREDVELLRGILRARAVENMFELTLDGNWDADREGRDLTMGLLLKILTAETC
jgi:hypothetical protein